MNKGKKITPVSFSQERQARLWHAQKSLVSLVEELKLENNVLKTELEALKATIKEQKK